MNEDFDKIFREQFQGKAEEEKKEKKESVKPQETPEAIPKKTTLPPVSSRKKQEKKDSHRERIRSRFFTSITQKKEEKKEKKHGLFASLVIGIANILIIIGIVVLIRTFLVSPFAVVGSSMEGTLHNGNLILVDKLSYRIGNPHRGDVIVFYPPVEKRSEQPGVLCTARKLLALVLKKDIESACNVKEFYVKRIIGTEGDEVEIKNRQVFVTPAGTNKRILLAEDFLLPKNKENTCFETSCNGVRDLNGVLLTVPENTVYVLGDNRTGSSDSRAWRENGKNVPFVPEENISGKVRAVFWPFGDMHILKKINILGETEKEKKQ